MLGHARLTVNPPAEAKARRCPPLPLVIAMMAYTGFMGHAFAEIELSNPSKPKLRPVQVRALADTGALMLCIPPHVALQLGRETESEREVTLADGQKQKVSYVGPLRVLSDGRSCFVGALVIGDEVLLGAVPMEDLDLVVSQSRRQVTVNPDSPNIPHARVKVFNMANLTPNASADTL